MIDHDEARALSAAALDFDLSAEDDQRLLAHMIGCVECRAFAEGLDMDASAIGGIASQDAPAGLRARVLAAVPERTPSPAVAPADMPAIPTPRPPRSGGVIFAIPRRYRGPLGLTAAAAVAIAIIGGGLVWRPDKDGLPNVAAGSPSATSRSGAGGSGAPAAGPSDPPPPSIEPSSRLAALPVPQVADLTADDAAGSVVGLASGFRLASLDGTPAVELVKRLTVEPEVAFSSSPEADGRSVHIVPSEPLTPGAVYRFSLKADDGREIGTWAFQAQQPLRIVGTLPENTATDVPVNTGIEVTFDQDGFVDAARHVSLSPKVDGRFEEHGRVIAFIPDHPLEAATIYTVTVTPGVEVAETGESLEKGVTFQFETGVVGTPSVEPTFQFTDQLFESATRERPVIAVWGFQDSDDDPPPPPPTSAPLEIYRIDGLDAAMETYRKLRAYPRWSQRASNSLVPTAGLEQVMTLDAQLAASEGTLWTELPEPLPAGWYLIHLSSPTRPIQAMLQVTDIASYLVVSDTKTLLWTNDLTSGKALAGAVAASSAGDLGQTGTDGTLVAPTPPALMPEPSGTCSEPCVALVTVRAGDRSSFVPASEPSDSDGKGGGYSGTADAGAAYWHSFDTDRSLFRGTDTVNTWGVIRDRDSGKVPTVVTISLSALDVMTGEAGPPLVVHDVHPSPVGAFSDSVAFDGLPDGTYELHLRAADHMVATTAFEVGRILKPAYRIDVTTGRRVYIDGDLIRVTATAAFYEGSPVPGVRLRMDGILTSSFTTNSNGIATRRTTAHLNRSVEDDDGGVEVQNISVAAASAEEGQIEGASSDIVVYPSLWTIDSTVTEADGRVRIRGTLSELDRGRVEREIAAGDDPWSVDPAGKPLGGRTVTLTFIDSVVTRDEAGTHYDFIEKKVVPTYQYRSTDHVVRRVKVETDAKGRFSASIPAEGDRHSYRVRATATDPDRHVAKHVEWATASRESDGDLDSSPTLTLTADPARSQSSFSVGDPIDLTMSDPRAADGSSTDRYLFYTAQRGLRDVTVQESARFRSTFGPAAAPGLYIAGVRFDGSRYSQTTAFDAAFESSDRVLAVGLSTDAARYAPGKDVRLTVTTRDRAGDPVAATVVLRAVDEKLFTLGGASNADPLREIYAGVGPGIRVTYRSHRSPRSDSGDGGGDTTGGGGDDRIDFKDQILFRSIETGSDGRASVTFHLSDDLTSWRVSASAFGSGLRVGEASLLVPIGLPFFADATLAPEYLASDRPEIGVRAFGTALKATSNVTFAVDSKSLGLHVTGLSAKAFKTVTVALPKLTPGRHDVTITARTGSGASARQDRLTRSFTVVASRLEAVRTAHQVISGVTGVEGGDGLTEVTVSDVGVGRYVPLVLGLTEVDSGRLERVLAAALAASLARDRFHVADATGAADFDGERFQALDGGLSLVPYGSSDLEASSLASLVAPDRFNRAGLVSYLSAIATSDKETRERRTIALAGLAGQGRAVLPAIRRAAADPALTIRERLFLGIGAAALGDASTAHGIAVALVDGYGEAVGDQARLRVGSDNADITEATALMAMLAAANGDPLATRFWSYVEANPDLDATYALHAVGFVTRVLDHAVPAAASFAYRSGGRRTVVELEPGDAFHVSLLSAQLASFTIEPITGSIAVTSSWREAVDPASFEKDPDIAIYRTVKPSGAISVRDLVTVELVVDLSRLANKGCHTVTDFAPSGLVPVGNLRGWVDPEEDESRTMDASPYAQVGQRVSFCAEARPDGGLVHLRYYARVISPGRYTWETAIAQSPFRPDSAALTGRDVIRIR